MYQSDDAHDCHPIMGCHNPSRVGVLNGPQGRFPHLRRRELWAWLRGSPRDPVQEVMPAPVSPEVVGGPGGQGGTRHLAPGVRDVALHNLPPLL